MKVSALLALLLLLVTACQAAEVCPAGSITYAADPTAFPPLDLPGSLDPVPTPALVKIAGKMREVDRVITGPVCNDVWSGTVYVACDVRLVEWQDKEKPAFFENCNLAIEPETVIYVAAHNDAASYNGCSCHMGGEEE